MAYTIQYVRWDGLITIIGNFFIGIVQKDIIAFYNWINHISGMHSVANWFLFLGRHFVMKLYDNW